MNTHHSSGALWAVKAPLSETDNHTGTFYYFTPFKPAVHGQPRAGGPLFDHNTSRNIDINLHLSV